MSGYELAPPTASPAAAPPADVRPRNRAGRASLIVAIVQVVVELSRQWAFQIQILVPGRVNTNYHLIETVNVTLSVIVGALAVTALVLGIIGLLVRSASRAAAAAGAAVGATTLLLLMSSATFALVAQIVQHATSRQ